MGFGSFVQVLRNRGQVPASLLPSVARMLVHALKQLHALKHVSARSFRRRRLPCDAPCMYTTR